MLVPMDVTGLTKFELHENSEYLGEFYRVL